MADTVTAISTPQPAGPIPGPITTPVTPAVEAPIVAPAAAVETSVAGSDTLLGGVNEVKQEQNTTDPKATTEIAAEASDGVKETTEGGQSDNPAPPPQYEAFKLPDNFSIKPERLTELTTLLSTLETEGKADHAHVQEFGQKAVTMYAEALKAQIAEINKTNEASFTAQKQAWKDSFIKDPVIGGSRAEATLKAADSFIRTHGGTEKQQKEFRALMNNTGIGNHPVMIRLLANAGGTMSEGEILAAPKPVPNTPKSKLSTLYGNSK